MGHFTPTCDNNGDYAAIQRHASTGYSWCVDTKTGKKIVGTDTRSQNPDCNKQVKGRYFILCLKLFVRGASIFTKISNSLAITTLPVSISVGTRSVHMSLIIWYHNAQNDSYEIFMLSSQENQ